MTTRTNITLAAIVATVAGLALAVQVRAGGDKVAFPEGFDKGTLYAVVDRYDIRQYRELYASKEAVDAVRKGQPTPSGTVLTLIRAT